MRGSGLWLGVALLGLWWVAVVAIGYPWTYAGYFSDSVSYLFLADWLSPWHEPISPTARELARQSTYPPGYPALLGLLGGGAAHIPYTHLIQSVLLATAVAACWFWARGRLDSSQAWIPPVVLAGSPVLVPYGLDPTTEALWLTLVFPVLRFLDRAERAPLTDREMILLGALAGWAMLTRLASLPLLLVLTHTLWRQRAQASIRLAAAALVWLPVLTWWVLRAARTGGGSYLDHPLTQFSARWVETPWTTLVAQGAAFAGGLVPSVTPSGLAAGACLVLVLFALPAWVRELSRAGPLSWFVLLYAAMVLVWPYPAEASRLLGVLLPVLAAYALIAIRQAAPGPRLRIGLTAALYVALLGPHLLHVGQRLGIPTPAELRPYQRGAAWFRSERPLELAEVMERARHLVAAMEARVAPNECVYSNAPALLSLWTARPVLLAPVGTERDDAPLCRWLVIVYVQYAQSYGLSVDQVYRHYHALGSPVLHSEFHDAQGRTVPAATLAELTWDERRSVPPEP